MPRIDPANYTEVPMATFYKVYANARDLLTNQEFRPNVQTSLEITVEQFHGWQRTMQTPQESAQLLALQTLLRQQVPAPRPDSQWVVCGVMFEGMKSDGTMPKDGEVGVWEQTVVGTVQGREIGVKSVMRDAANLLILDTMDLGKAVRQSP